MGNIIPSTEEIEKLQRRFLTDRRIATLNNEIAALYNISIPKAIAKVDGNVKIIYDDTVEYEVKRIQEIIFDIIKNEYLELLYQY